jgi:hypothetical protein
MSILDLKTRPMIQFDAGNLQHRKEYAKFIKSKSWGYCPVRFAVLGSRTDLVTQIERDLVDHYVYKEFKTKNTYR